MEQCSRLALLDVDGTLVAPMGDMPAGTAEAVAALRRGGSAAVFFTGRPLSHVAPLLRGAAFDGGICVMGAFAFLHGETLCARSPDPASAPRLAAAARERGLETVFETTEGVRLDPTAHTPRLDGLRRAFAAKGLVVSPAEGEFSYEKLCLWGEAGALSAFARAAEGTLAVVGRKQDMMEPAAPGVSPAAAAALIMARLGAAKENTYAVGDSVNDLPVLSCAGHTAAVGNADAALKAAADFVALSIGDGGLAEALRHFGLI